MIKLKKKQYKCRGKIDKFLEEVILEENNIKPPGEKSLGDAYLDEHTAIDVKSIDMDGDFHMGNLASQQKIRKWLQDKRNSLLFFFIEYTENDGVVAINSTQLKHIEEIHPDSLAIRAQGRGVMQINNWDKIQFIEKMDREEWFKTVYAPKALEYCDKEEIKIKELREVIKDLYEK